MDKSFVDLFKSFCCQGPLFSYGELSLEFYTSDWFFFLICDFFKSFRCPRCFVSFKSTDSRYDHQYQYCPGYGSN